MPQVHACRPVTPKSVPPKSGPPRPIFAKKWSPGPILAAKIGLPRLILAAKIGPPLPKTVPPLIQARMHSQTGSGKHYLLSSQKRSIM